MPRGRKRAAAAAPTEAETSQGQRKRMRVGVGAVIGGPSGSGHGTSAGAGARGRNARLSVAVRHEREEDSADPSEGNGDSDFELDVGDDNEEEDDDDDDNDDDKEAEATRKALRDLQAAMQRTEKKDNYAKDFEKYIGQEERRLLELLENGVRKRESESEKFRSQITSLLASALAPTATKATTAAGKALNSKADAQKLSLEDVSPEKHPLYLRSQALLQCTKSLVQEYDKLSAYIANLEPPPDPAETWQRDCAETRRVIAVGVEASQAEVERLLVRKADQRKKDAKEKSTSKGAKDGKGSKEAFEKDEHLQAMLKMGRGGDGDGNGDGKKKEPYGWGRVAHRVVKGMKSLVKGLPAE